MVARMSVPTIRVRAVNDASFRADGDYVVYWMTSTRRRRYNFGLQRAVEWAEQLCKPLVILEALRVGYRWASDRLHGFVLDGMAENLSAFGGGAALYHPYVEPTAGAGAGFLDALSAKACVVVTDYFPAFFLPQMIAAAGKKLAVKLECVDSCGLLPIAAADRDFPTAYVFRRFLQKNLASHLAELPDEDPLAGKTLPRLESLPNALTTRWPMASEALLSRDPRALAKLPIDHEVGVVPLQGGAAAAEATLSHFLDENLAKYGEGRNHPDDGAASGLSPYLHFGHLSVHEVLARIADDAGWTPAKLARTASGKREGWWNLPAPVESFLDEIVTWRELGYNHCARNPDTYDRYESLPAWARASLEKHESDPRSTLYTREQLANSQTHDPIWNAAQTELRETGRMHNYLRMLWGKKILEWSESPRVALEHLIELNNRYAVDGRNPNSYTGIFWTLGRYDRPWAPERAIFGVIRYMSSDSTKKKLHMKAYLAKYGGGQKALL